MTIDGMAGGPVICPAAGSLMVRQPLRPWKALGGWPMADLNMAVNALSLA